jgi:hypothetical protein
VTTNGTANLQTGLTVKQAARALAVSERMVYMCRELLATGRDDLAAAVERGEMTILGALKIAKPLKYGRRTDGLKRLLAAWQAASEDERNAFLGRVAPREAGR